MGGRIDTTVTKEACAVEFLEKMELSTFMLGGAFTGECNAKVRIACGSTDPYGKESYTPCEQKFLNNPLFR